MTTEIKTDSIPGIVPMVSSGNSRVEVARQLSDAGCDCDKGCDCFDSGDCFDICDRAPDFKSNVVPNDSRGKSI
jgi:hypothetical protein